MNVSEDDQEADTGIIESLHLKNFMCHTNYQIEFGPQVDIVIGRNGSGKSSILSAIQIGLGGKASSCGKAVALKNLVQRGKPYAEVSVTLRNRGSDAFQPQKYGTAITVERKITVDGTSSYKLKDSKDNVISTKKEDLTDILSTFNIQVNNPVAILTQEMSKTFLNTKDPKEKYNLFCQATQLEQLQNMYKNCEGRADNVRSILEYKEMNLRSLKDKKESLENVINNYRSVEENQNQLAQLYYEFAWSVAIEKEQVVDKLAGLMQEKKSAAEEVKSKLQGIKEHHAAVAEQRQRRGEQIQQINGEIETLFLLQKEQCNQAKEIQKSIRERQNRLDTSAKAKSIAGKQKEVEALELQIGEMRMQTVENSRKQKLQIEEQIMVCRKEIEVYGKQRNILLEKLNSSKANIATLQEQASATKDQYRAFNALCDETGRQIEKLNKQKSNNLFAYGRNTPVLLKKIKEGVDQGLFLREPIGPLGLYVKVKDRKWALAIECCLNKLLKSFLCDNVEDQFALFGIMTQVFDKKQATPQVITRQFINRVHDVSAVRVYSDDFPCVLDMIQVEMPVVYNCLVDERGIENILLIPTVTVARDIMMKNPPKNCHEVFTNKGNSVFPYPTYRFYSNRKKISTLIGVPSDLSENIRVKSFEVQTARASAETLEVEMNDIYSQLHLLERCVKALEANISDLDCLINRLQVDIQVLQETEVSDDVCGLESELVNLKNALQNTVNESTTETKELSNVKEQLMTLNCKIKETNCQINKKKTECDGIMKNLNRSCVDFERISKQMETFQKHYDASLKKLKEVEDSYQEQLAIKEKEIAMSEGMCQRIHTSRKPRIIEASIEHVKTVIREAEQNTPNIESTIASYETVSKEYRKIVGEIRCLLEATEKLQSMMLQRQKAFEHLRLHIGFRVSFLFTASIYPLGYCGNLKFDHDNRTLNVNVKFGKDVKTSARSLSGGEKSYITIALLLALWDAVELPFRIMDEYDVYMDQVNRKRSMDLMIDTATSRGGNQFIFFSPQLLPKMDPSKNIKILRLPDPDRIGVQLQRKRKRR